MEFMGTLQETGKLKIIEEMHNNLGRNTDIKNMVFSIMKLLCTLDYKRTSKIKEHPVKVSEEHITEGIMKYSVAIKTLFIIKVIQEKKL